MKCCWSCLAIIGGMASVSAVVPRSSSAILEPNAVGWNELLIEIQVTKHLGKSALLAGIASMGCLAYSIGFLLLAVPIATASRLNPYLLSAPIALGPIAALTGVVVGLWGTQSPSSSMSHSQKVTEQRKARTGYDLRPS